MKDLINKVLDGYLNFYNDTRKPSEHEIADIIVHKLPEAISISLNLDKEKYSIAGSIGEWKRKFLYNRKCKFY